MAWPVRDGEVLGRLEVATTLAARSRGLLGRNGIDGAMQEQGLPRARPGREEGR